jgi:hypothetical protein
MKRELFLTPGGSEISLTLGPRAPLGGRDATGIVATVTHASGRKRVRVEFDALVNTEGISLPESPVPEIDENPMAALAVLAVIDYVDTDPASLADESDTVIAVDYARANRLIRRPCMNDRDLRRFLARWVHTVYRRNTLQVRIELWRIDELITGCSATAIDRNIGVLEAEGYLTRTVEIGNPLGNPIVSPSVKLVRDVERYGAAREDAAAERDYVASLRAYPALASHRDGVILEWERYSTARTSTELVSVFRALVPFVEAVLGDTLRSHGSAKSNATLPPMIAELQHRQLADRGLLAKLNHIIVFARDLATHGASLSEPVVRIACENTFDLIPQIAALAKGQT